MTENSEEAEAERHESQPERLDRNTVELLNELRIAGTGIQVMFAFLLILPFNVGWKQVDGFERTVYFATLLVVALAAFLLLRAAGPPPAAVSSRREAVSHSRGQRDGDRRDGVPRRWGSSAS